VGGGGGRKESCGIIIFANIKKREKTFRGHEKYSSTKVEQNKIHQGFHSGWIRREGGVVVWFIIIFTRLLLSLAHFLSLLCLCVCVSTKENSVVKEEEKQNSKCVKIKQSVSGLLRDFAGRKRPLAWDCRTCRCYRWPTSPVEGPTENS
jgi:hypothetical protein